MPHLTIDIGNSAAKLAIADNGRRISDVYNIEHEAIITRAKEICHDADIHQCIVASVAANNDALRKSLNNIGLSVAMLTADSNLTFQIDYATPSTLGADRIAAVAGAVSELGRRDMFIIDAGTAVTYELFTADGIYRGGSIAPGMSMRFRALHAFTQKLPLVDASEFRDIIGQSTHEAIAAGVVAGMNFEAEGYYNRLREKLPHLKTIILTGGDHKYFDLKVKSDIFARPNLVTDGLAALSLLPQKYT